MSAQLPANGTELEAKGISLDLQIPERAVRGHVEIDGYKLATITIEPVGKHVGTALLVPGYTSSADTFNMLLQPLSERGYKVVSFSQRGQCLSEGPDETDGYALARLGKDIHEVIQKLGLGTDVHLLGHSFGGVVSIEAVLQDHSPFASLTMWNSGPRNMGGDLLEQRAGLLEHGPRAYFVGNQLATGQDPEADIKGELNIIEQYYYDRLMSTNPVQLEAGINILIDQVDRTLELSRTGIPVLVSHGANDDAWPVEMQRVMAEQLGADYWVIANAGHSAHADRTHASAQLLATFWDEH
ncbi:MAG: alpha/beta hydrolase [Actinomycetales bacterium]|nr:alpha/beta hydrolase [Actinomycetales bacterium]